MSLFPLHTKETAPDDAKPVMDAIEAKFGFLPNLAGSLAEAPTALKAYAEISGIFAGSTLTPGEQQIVLLSVSRFNNCEYCVAAHSTGAAMAKVPDEAVAALRDGEPVSDSRLQALRVLTEKMVDKRGWLTDEDINAFLSAGFIREQVLEVIVGVAMKTISNYVNHIAETPLDDAFAPKAWKKAG